MKIGIPRAGMYFRHKVLWECFFENLNIEIVLSPKTDKRIIDQGSSLISDESCLASKIFMGHIDYLIDKCDLLFIPWLSNYGKDGINCTRFRAYHTIVSNVFRDKNPQILTYCIDLSKTQGMKNASSEEEAFLSMHKALGKTKKEVLAAYRKARKSADEEKLNRIKSTENSLCEKGKKVLVVGRDYCIYDEYIGKPILKAFENYGISIIDANNIDSKEAQKEFLNIADNTLPWIISRELLGGLSKYKNKVDGIVILTCFPCGPDSIVNDVIQRNVKDKPLLYLLLDAQDGTAGIETRIESFVDILSFRDFEV